MRKPPNRTGLYADVIPILDAALTTSGGVYSLPSHGEAVAWRQRAYKFRKHYAEQNPGPSRYDRISIPRVLEHSGDVVINLRIAAGVFTPNAEPVDTFDDFDPDMLNAAEALAREIDSEL